MVYDNDCCVLAIETPKSKIQLHGFHGNQKLRHSAHAVIQMIFVWLAFHLFHDFSRNLCIGAFGKQRIHLYMNL